MTEADRIAKEAKPLFHSPQAPTIFHQRSDIVIDIAAHLINLLERWVVAREKEVGDGN